MSGKILDMSHADYLARSEYGASDIIKMADSFAMFRHKKENPDPAGRPLVVGNATHLMVQGEVLGDKLLAKEGILVYQDGSSGTKGFRTFQADNPTKYCLDSEEDLLCKRMVKALLSEPEVVGYLSDAIPEATVIANYPGSDIRCKVRPDYLHMKRGVSVNLKTTADASESGFLYAARDFGYDWQSALYCTILSAELGRQFDEVHILVQKGESDAECVIEIFSFGDDTLNFARSQIWELLQGVAKCESTGIWPKRKPYLKTLDLPQHMRRVVAL